MPNIAPAERIAQLIDCAGNKWTKRFVLSEWTQVVDAWNLETWESYRDVPRLGRRTRLPEAQRAELWEVFSSVRKSLADAGLTTEAQVFTRLASALAGHRAPYDYAIVDEAQDVSVAQLRFLAAIGGNRRDALFFAGDLGQRIFQQPFSWKALGVDIRGRSTTLKICYRTSHQIRTQADRLLGASVTDVDGNTEERKGTTSVFNGPLPAVESFTSEQAEIEAVAAWLKARLENHNVQPHEIGIFVRGNAQIARAESAAKKAGLKSAILDENVEIRSGRAAIGTMHLAKGLEFRAVVVMACDDEVIPSQERIESAADDSDLEEIYNTERHLLYVACTRARDFLLVSAVKPASEFLEDLMPSATLSRAGAR